MKPLNDISGLDVLLHGQRVGQLTRFPDERTAFTFDPEYMNQPHRPTLSLSFQNEHGGLEQPTRLSKRKLPSFFSNLLPEGHLREYLAQRGGIKPEREFHLLHLLGQDLPGALTVQPSDSPSMNTTTRKESENPEDDEPPYRFSLAGVQLKFSAIESNQKGGGLTIPASGKGGQWIVKLPSTRWEGVPENEFSMMSLAREIGLPVSEIQLIDTKDIEGLPKDLTNQKSFLKQKSLAVKRFDRLDDGTPVHMEDMAQVFGLYPHEKYQKLSNDVIAKLLWQQAGEASTVQFIQQMVFNILIGNDDAHSKNWSLLYPDRMKPVLSPAYDLVSTIAYLSDSSMALSLSGTKSMEGISMNHFDKLADKVGIPKRLVKNTVKETIERFHEAWEAHSEDLPLMKVVKSTILKHQKQLSLPGEYRL